MRPVMVLVFAGSIAWACSSSSTNPAETGGAAGVAVTGGSANGGNGAVDGGGSGGAAGPGGSAGSSNGGFAGSGMGGTAGAAPFPSTFIIDDFGYGGTPDSGIWNTLGPATDWLASNGSLLSQGATPASIWTNETFVETQEAFVTVNSMSAEGRFYLLFGCQGPCGCRYLKYESGKLSVGQETSSGGTCDDADSDYLMQTLTDGDQIGVRTLSSNEVEVYVNHALKVTFSLSSSPGSIGLGADFSTATGSYGVVVSAFGGGSVL